MANNAARVVTDHVNGTVDPGVLARGGGRVDVVEAFAADTWFDPVSVSFGGDGNKPVSGSVKVTVKDIDGAADSCSVSVAGSPYVSVSPSTVSVGAGGTTTFTVSLNAGRSLAPGYLSGDVTLVCGATTLKAPWFVRKS